MKKSVFVVLVLALLSPLALGDMRGELGRVRGSVPVGATVIVEHDAEAVPEVVDIEVEVEVEGVPEETAETLDAEPEDGLRPDLTPFVRVARFLQLTQEQRAAWKTLLEIRAATVRPLKVELAEVRQQLKAFLEDPSADPEVGGELLREAAELRAAIAEAHRTYVEDFELLLDADQSDRLRAMRLAGKLQPLLPAFRKTGLVAPLHRP